MEDIIQPIIHGKKPEEVLELVLDKAKINDLRLLQNVSSQFYSLESLSLRGVGLTSLENFPYFPKLKKLELSENKIADGLHHLSKLNSLVYLNLAKNKIRRIRDLEPLSSLESLQVLNLLGCAVTNTPDYKVGIFTLLPTLKSLDKVDNYGNSWHNADNDNDDSQSTSEDERFSHYGARAHSIHLKEEESLNSRPKTKPPPQNGKLYKVNETADEDLSITSSSSSPISRNNAQHSPMNNGSHHVTSRNSNSNSTNNNNSKRRRENASETFQDDEIIDISSSPPNKQEKPRDPNSNLPLLAPSSPVRLDEKEEEKKRKESLSILLMGDLSDDSDDEDDEFEPEDDEEEEDSEEDDDEERMSGEDDSDSDGKKRKAPTPDVQPTKKRK